MSTGSINSGYRPLTRKEAIMMGDESVTPMTREEAILANQEGLKVFTKDEYLRLNNYVRTTSADLDVPDIDDHVMNPINQ